MERAVRNGGVSPAAGVVLQDFSPKDRSATESHLCIVGWDRDGKAGSHLVDRMRWNYTIWFIVRSILALSRVSLHY